MSPPTRRRGLAAARHIAVELTPQAVEQIASRVAQLLRHQQPPAPASPPHAPAWLTVKELASHLKLNPAWVYEHAEQLGAIRTGSGPKARLRFDLHTATQALKRQQQPTPASPPRRKPTPRPAPYPTDTPLLQIRDPYPRSVRGCHARTRSHGRLAVS